MSEVFLCLPFPLSNNLPIMPLAGFFGAEDPEKLAGS